MALTMDRNVERYLDELDLRRLEYERRYDMEGWQDGRAKRVWTLRRPDKGGQ